jgi:hypothetical protein
MSLAFIKSPCGAPLFLITAPGYVRCDAPEINRFDARRYVPHATTLDIGQGEFMVIKLGKELRVISLRKFDMISK